MVSGELPPRKIPPPGLLSSRQLPPRKIASCMIAPDLILLGNYPKDNCPLTLPPWKLLLRKITFRMICRLHNCPSDKWSLGKLPPRKIVPRISHTQDIFSSRIRNLSTLINSCFLLFFFFVV